MYIPFPKSGPVLALFFCHMATAVAVPVAVNDAFTTPEDVPAGSVAVGLLNADFEGGGGAVSFTLPNAWQIIDLATSAAGGTNTYPPDGAARSWKSIAYDTATSTVPGWRAGTFPVKGGDISHANFTAVASTLTGVVPGGTNTVNTYLMRNVFTMSAGQAAHPTWEFSVLADDGAIIYVNGVEKARLNYPLAQAVEVDATNGGNAGDEGAYTTIPVDLTGTLVAGQNVISIELHQNSATSSDAGIDLIMTPVASAATFGFAGVDDAFFGTANPAYSAQSHTATGGFNGGGGLSVQLGNVGVGAASQQVSGAWRRSFTLATAGTVNVSFRQRLISGQDYDNGEYQELICDVDGTAYGNITSPGTHPAVAFLTGNGNGGGAQDTGWGQSSFNIALAAGTHTLSLGGYGSAGSAGFLGNAAESFEGFFDDVVITAAANVSLLSNDTGGVPPVTAVKVANPSHGTVTVNSDGTFLYTPVANYNGTDTFTYRAVDGSGQSAPATVTITITPVNDPPVAVADGPYSTGQDAPLTVSAALGVLANDADAEGAVLTAEVGVAPVSGVLILNANGGFTYTPNAGFAGADSFSYRANDGTAASPFVTATLNVINVPDAPSAVADSFTAVKNTALTVTALTGGTVTEEVLPYKSADWHYYDSIILADRNLNTLWRTEAYTESAAWKTGPAELGYGDGDEATTIADNPDPAFDSGASDKFATAYFRRMVEVADFYNITGVELTVLYDDAAAVYLNGAAGLRTSNLPDAATLPELAWDYIPNIGSTENSTQTFNLPASVLRSGSNLIAAEVHQNAATSSDLSFDLRLRVNRAIAAGLLANDSDPDPGETALLTAEAVTLPAHGTLALNANGTFTYTPATNYLGADSFTYRAKDPTNRTSAAVTVSLTVIDGPNVPPTAAADTYAAVEDTVLNVNAAAGVLANDSDAESDAFTAIVATPPAHGTLTLNTDGSFSYQPEANFNGQDTFTYQARDARSSAPALVTLNVSSVNDLPVAVNNSYAGDPGTPFTVAAAQGVLANDTDADTGTTLTAAVVTPPAGASLTLNPDGSFTLTAAAGGVFTFTYRASDGIGQSNAATVTVSLNAVPVPVADAYTINEDQPLNPSAATGVLANDSDPEGQPLTAQLASSPQNGTLALNPDGSFLFTPQTNFNGTDAFSYRVSDGVRLSAPTIVTLTVSAVNDAPAAVADLFGVRLDTALQVNAANGVLRNDSDAENGSLTAALFAPPASGNLLFNSDGSFTYTPVAGFTGSVTFSYRASDGTAVSAVTTVTLNVSAFLNTLAISEIMYNPPGAAGTAQEFLEVYNYGDASVDLTGWSFTKGVNYLFPAGTLVPGRGYMAIPADRTAFLAAYPGTANVTSTGWGIASSLGNGGELIRLVNALGETVDEVEYADEGDWAQRRVV
ncbi:MAG: outer rane adhesin like protein, partial [Verrucomicrobiales bacterium]|nr:outer rane adhesin like protein [Verrucomicrobiales bacterium]